MCGFIFYGCPGFFFFALIIYYILFKYSEHKTLKPWGENQQEEKRICDDSGVIISNKQGKAREAGCLWA